MKPKLNRDEKTVQLTRWIKLRDGSWKCGNAKVKNIGGNEIGKREWIILFRTGDRWIRYHARSRSYPHFSAQGAKYSVSRTRFWRKHHNQGEN